MPEIHRLELATHHEALIQDLLGSVADRLEDPRSGLALAGDSGVLVADAVIDTETLGFPAEQVTVTHLGDYETVRRRLYPEREVYLLDDATGIQVSMEDE